MKQTNTLWQSIRDRLSVGSTLKDGAYIIVSTDDKRIRVERVKTGSPVTVSRRMVEKTANRLAAGEFIERRSISYTVAIETVAIAALGTLVTETTQDNKRGYTAGGN